MISSNALCPCGSNKKYNECCQLIIRGAAIAQSAEALMRSRYSAFVLGESGYLLDSHHSSTRPGSLDTKDSPPWCKLEIIGTNKGKDKDVKGTVEFKATAVVKSRVITLHETSQFIKENGRWYYVNGEQHASLQEQKTGKIGRNSPCPCGSGKKFKRCCFST